MGSPAARRCRTGFERVFKQSPDHLGFAAFISGCAELQLGAAIAATQLSAMKLRYLLTHARASQM
jgi:hypothetical protein